MHAQAIANLSKTCRPIGVLGAQYNDTDSQSLTHFVLCIWHKSHSVEHPHDVGRPASLTAACSMAAPKFLWELMRILSFLALCKADMALCLYLCTCACTYVLCLYLRTCACTYLCLYLCTCACKQCLYPCLVPMYLCLHLCTVFALSTCNRTQNPYAGLQCLLIQGEMCMHHNNAAAVHFLVPPKQLWLNMSPAMLAAQLCLPCPCTLVCMTDRHLTQTWLQHAPPGGQ